MVRSWLSRKVRSDVSRCRVHYGCRCVLPVWALVGLYGVTGLIVWALVILSG